MPARRTEGQSAAARAAAPPRPPVRRGLGGRLRGALVDNAGLKIVSVILALTVYLLVNTDEYREINARVSVAYVLPSDKALVSERIDEVQVTIRGPWRRIKRFDEREIDRITLDLTDVAGGEVAITRDMIDLPRGLEITSIQPRVVRVAFEDVETKQVPVREQLAGRPLHGYHVIAGRTRVAPAQVTVRGAAGVVRPLELVRTQEIRLDGRSDDFTVPAEIVAPEGVQVDWDGPVEVTVSVEEELVTRRRTGVPVIVRATTGGADADGDGAPAAERARWKVEPAEVAVELTGGLLAVEGWLDRGVEPVVVVPAETPPGARKLDLPVVVPDAPPGIGVRVSPPTVTVIPIR